MLARCRLFTGDSCCAIKEPAKECLRRARPSSLDRRKECKKVDLRPIPYDRRVVVVSLHRAVIVPALGLACTEAASPAKGEGPYFLKRLWLPGRRYSGWRPH